MNDKKHKKIKRALKIIGPIVLVYGLALAITGIVDFGTSAAGARALRCSGSPL